MKCEGFSQITDLVDYLDNNRLIAHYCGFNIMEPLPSYWTYDRFLRKLNNTELKSIMADLVRQLYELGIVDASFIGLDSTPVMANTRQNNPKSFVKDKFSKSRIRNVTRTAPWVSIPPLTSTMNADMSLLGIQKPCAGRLYLRAASIRADHTSKHHGFHSCCWHPCRSRPNDLFAGVFFSCG